jgi:hypothetical protein
VYRYFRKSPGTAGVFFLRISVFLLTQVATYEWLKLSARY